MSDTRGKLLQVKQHIEAGRWESAKTMLMRVLRNEPNHRDALVLMRFVLTHLDEPGPALHYAERALALAPSDPDLRTNLANSLIKLGRQNEAVDVLEPVAAARPDHLFALMALAYAYRGLDRYTEAAATAERGLRLSPGHRELAELCGACQILDGRADHAVQVLRAAALAAGPTPTLLNVMASAHTYAAGVEPADVTASHAAYGRQLEKMMPIPRRIYPQTREPQRRIRVGFVSGDLRQHASRYFTFGLFEHFDRERMEFVCYSMWPGPGDDHTERYQRLVRSTVAPGDGWRPVAGLSHLAMAEAILKDHVDVLIDLSGHTAGHALPVFHLRPAPVQMTWMGYPNTTGMRAMDYRIVDSLTDPPGTEGQCVERLLRIDPCFVSYEPPPGAPQVTEPPALRHDSPSRGVVTFGSFTSLQKINEPLMRLWIRVLRAAPGSRLFLKNHGLGSLAAQSALRSRFAACGLPPERLELEGPAPSTEALLHSYAKMDVTLDSVPYNGTTTLCESMLMGVPVVTLMGATPPGRVARSLLQSVGLGELVAYNDDRFVEYAANLARDWDRLAELRSTLRDRMLASALCDGRGFAQRFEAAVRGAWQEWCTGAASAGGADARAA